MSKTDRHQRIDAKLAELDPPTSALGILAECEGNASRAAFKVYDLTGIWVTSNTLRNWRDAVP